MAIRPSMTPNQTDEERIEQMFPTWFRKLQVTFSGELPLTDEQRQQVLVVPYALFKQALIEIVREARIDELHQAFKHIENGQNWNDYIHRAIDQLSTNNNTEESR